MTFEMADRVPGLSEEQMKRLVDDAEAGYDLDIATTEPNPHHLMVPADLFVAITARAERDGESVENVVRQALAAYLDTA